MVDIMNNFVFNTLAEVTVQLTSPRCALIMMLKALIIPFTLFRRLLSARVSKTKVKFHLTYFFFFAPSHRRLKSTLCFGCGDRITHYHAKYLHSIHFAYNLLYSPNKLTVTLLAFSFFKMVAIPAEKEIIIN